MSGTSDPKDRLADLDERLRSLEADGRRDGDEFDQLTREREDLLNAREDD